MEASIASRSFPKPVGRLMRPAGFALLATVALLAAAPLSATAAATSQPSVDEPRFDARPQWLGFGDRRPALKLIGLLQGARLDGLDSDQFNIAELQRALRATERGSMAAADRANELLDRALVQYVAALRRAPASEWIINDREAAPQAPSSDALLREAASAPSLEAWLDAMPFMHPSYADQRRALADAEDQGDVRSAELLRLNLRRVRFLPASGRYVLVNTAAQQLYLYERGQMVDSMRVVVGKPHQPTPMMAATIKYTALNPYWQVPPDLAAERVAPNVVKEGLGYLQQHGYVLLSDWGEQATPVDPSTVDWAAVAAGQVQVRLRQEPGPGNAMGRMKFMFPNPQGIYLHDTPNKELLNEAARLFSGGCVRLEDAPRLAQWLHGQPLNWREAETDQAVPLEEPVPVYLIYQTAVADGDRIVFHQDIYGSDRSQLAGSDKPGIASR